MICLISGLHDCFESCNHANPLIPKIMAQTNYRNDKRIKFTGALKLL